MKTMMKSFTTPLKKFIMLSAVALSVGTVSGADLLDDLEPTFFQMMWVHAGDMLKLSMGGRTWTGEESSGPGSRRNCPLHVYGFMAPQHTTNSVYLSHVTAGEGAVEIDVPTKLRPLAESITSRKSAPDLEFSADHSKVTVRITPPFLNTLEITAFNLATTIECMALRDAWDNITWPSSTPLLSTVRTEIGGYQKEIKGTENIGRYTRRVLENFTGSACFIEGVDQSTASNAETFFTHLTVERYVATKGLGSRGKPDLGLREEEKSAVRRTSVPKDSLSGLQRGLAACIGFLLIERESGYKDSSSDVLPSTLLTSWLERVLSESPRSTPAGSPPGTPPKRFVAPAP